MNLPALRCTLVFEVVVVELEVTVVAVVVTVVAFQHALDAKQSFSHSPRMLEPESTCAHFSKFGSLLGSFFAVLYTKKDPILENNPCAAKHLCC